MWLFFKQLFSLTPNLHFQYLADTLSKVAHITVIVYCLNTWGLGALLKGLTAATWPVWGLNHKLSNSCVNISNALTIMLPAWPNERKEIYIWHKHVKPYLLFTSAPPPEKMYTSAWKSLKEKNARYITWSWNELFYIVND